ncbi:MAG: AsmA-like C-terminal region-containing protein, partial [Flavitalea sp.]
MSKFLRYSIRVVVITIGLIAAIWVVLWIYISLNEASLIDKLYSKIKERTRGETRIGGLSVSIFKTFPLVSLQIKEVLLRDSLYPIHKKDFLKAKNIYLRLSIPGLISGKSPLGKIIISDGDINIITDSSGVSNNYIFKSGQNQGNKEKDPYPSIPEIALRRMLLSFVNPLKSKFHQMDIDHLNGIVKNNDGMYELSISVDMLVKSLAFNTQKGSYIKNKPVKGDFGLIVDAKKKDLLIDEALLNIDNHPFIFKGWFHLDKTSPDFNLSIQAKNIDFDKMAALLTDTQQSKLKGYSFKKPVTIQATLSGKTLYKYIPLAVIEMNVKDNDLVTAQGTFEKCSFNGRFTNERIPGKPRMDDNAFIHVSNFSAEWEKIKLAAQSIKVSDLVAPFLECDLRSIVDLPSLNDLSGSGAFHFIKGSGIIDIVFKGPVSGRDSVLANLNGEVAIKDASIKYIPRNFILSDCNGILRFNNNDLQVNRFNVRVGKTHLQMNGHARNFLSMLNISPEKLALYWKVYADSLHLEDFKAFLSRTGDAPKKAAGAKFKGASSQVDKFFSDGDIYIDIETPNMDYKHFNADHVQANVILKPGAMALERMNFQHAKGSMQLSGIMRDGKISNPVQLHTRMKNMDIKSLFTSFDNFGQDAVTNANLQGRLSADIEFSGAITDKATLVKEASKGSISFLLENGELNNFEPIQKIAEKIFKKQDFSAIRFADI